jgi:hypothetical protein|tara:strand:+ start:10 stop:249 length:240 start_codon:yes stop_codon:yes gene_type:complete
MSTEVKTKTEDTTVTQPATATQPENSVKPVFEEIEGMDQNTAISVLIQSAELAQKAGVLSMRDSVVLAKAISLFAPGKI